METVTVTVNRSALSKQMFSSITRMFFIVLSNYRLIVIVLEKYYLLSTLSDHCDKVFQIKRFEMGLFVVYC